MFQFTIPANGSSVPVADFAAEAEKVYDGWLESASGKEASEEQKDQVRAAIDAADALISGGHGGSDNVFVSLSGNANEGHVQPAPGRLESLVSIAVHQRPASTAAPTAEVDETAPAKKPRAKKGDA